jgi:shikimate kinase
VTPRVVLVGLPGSGKSSTARRLAKILALPCADSDELVEQTAGRSVQEIFAAEGEGAFRQREQDAIVSALSAFEGVLALGGGALTRDVTRHALRDSGAVVVLLTASIATLAARVGAGEHRPLLAGDPTARLVELGDERAAHYAEVATLTVDTEGRTPSQVAAHIAARLHRIDHPTSHRGAT